MKKKRVNTNILKPKDPSKKSLYHYFLWKRIIYHSLLLIILPIFLILHLCLGIYHLISPKSSTPIIYKYLRYFFKSYFYMNGVNIIDVFPTPEKKPKKPTVFFTTRPNELYCGFLTTIFNYQVSTPYPNRLSRFPIHHFFPFIKLGIFIKCLGYQDLELKNNIKNIKKSLSASTPTIIYLNEKYANPFNMSQLSCYSEILELLETDIDCYFLACKGFERYNIGTFIIKRPIKVFCIPAEDLFKGVKQSERTLHNKLIRIMKFYEFKSIKVI